MLFKLMAMRGLMDPEPGAGGGGAPAPAGGEPSGGDPSGGQPAGGEPSGGQPAGGGAPAGGQPAPAGGEPSGGQPPAPAGGEPAKSFLQDLPEDWRGQMVQHAFGEDGGELAEKANKYLERVPDTATLVKNYVESQEKIRRGEVTSGLPENPSEEQLARYREANGIPAKPEEYDVEPGGDLVLGEDDQRIMEPVKQVAHKHNVPAAALKEMTTAMMQAREREYEAIQQQDGLDTQQAQATLKQNWGPDYTRNENAVRGLIRHLPESVREDFLHARLANGKAVFNEPSLMEFFKDMAFKTNPAGTVVPDANNPVQAIKDEIAELESQMGTPEWYRDTDKQQRYQDLLRAQDEMNAQSVT